MTAKIFCRHGPLRGVELEFEDDATIGRASDNDLALDVDSVSQRHARIFRDPELARYVLEDLGSTNGCLVDGGRVKGTVSLGALHVISFGGSGDFVFQSHIGSPLAGEDRPPGSRTATVRDATSVEIETPVLLSLAATSGISPDHTVAEGSFETVVMPVLGRVPSERPGVVEWILEVTVGDQPPRRLRLAPGEHVFGRAQGCEIHVVSENVSRRHARLRVTPEAVFVRDLGSKNGTSVDGEAVAGEIAIAVGSRLVVGDAVARLLPVADGGGGGR